MEWRDRYAPPCRGETTATLRRRVIEQNVTGSAIVKLIDSPAVDDFGVARSDAHGACKALCCSRGGARLWSQASIRLLFLAGAMKAQPRKVDVALTAMNLGFWIWAVSHMKQHGNYLGGPHLIALIAMMLSLLVWYRSVLAARRA